MHAGNNELTIAQEVIKAATGFGGGVTRFRLPSGQLVCRITTFCPSTIGPGPTHLFLLQEGDELVLVDTGIGTGLAKRLFYRWRNQPLPSAVESLPDDLSEQQLNEGLALLGHQSSEITRIVITHGHLDHYLLGRTLTEKHPSIKVVAHLFDTDMICNPWELFRTWVMRRPELLALGMPPPGESEGRRQVWEEIPLGLRVDQPVAKDGPLDLGTRRSSLVTTRNLPGHTAGSICLLVGQPGENKIMLCGDLLLNPITPHPNDLLAYLRSLKELEAMSRVAVVLPAHGLPIENLGERCKALQLHHRHRLELAYRALHKPRSVWDIATMDGYFDVYVHPQRFNPLAAQEAFVHVQLLELVGAVALADIKKGIHYYIADSQPFDEVHKRILEVVASPPAIKRTRSSKREGAASESCPTHKT